MSMKYDLNELKMRYNNNENIVEYVRSKSGTKENTVEQIMLSYECQAGSYVEAYSEDPGRKERFLARLVETILSKSISGSLLEAGTGEATSLVPLLNLLPTGYFREVYAFDASWSRIKVAKNFSVSQNCSNIQFFTGDMLNIPVIDDYFDLVLTVCSLEPNGGKEKELLQELYRVCRNYMILLEPCYEFAGEEARQRMQKHGYITNLLQAARELDYHVETYELYGSNIHELNPIGIMIIRKDGTGLPDADCPFADPETKKPMTRYEDSFYCPDSMLAYPIIQSIPCLQKHNAVVAAKYLD